MVETILALYSVRGTNPDDMTDADRIRLMMGQKLASEQTMVWQTTHIDRIDIDTNPPISWDPPTADPAPGKVANDKVVTLHHPVADLVGKDNIGVKIYYTLDGETPSNRSTMFNVSAWEPNPPIVLSGSGEVTIKAIVIGPGKTESSVAVFTYTLDN